MPRKYPTWYVADTFKKYGYSPKFNFRYDNANKSYKMWSNIDQKMVRMSFSKLKRLINTGKAVEYKKSLDDFFNTSNTFENEFGSLRTDQFKHNTPKSHTHTYTLSLLRLRLAATLIMG